jgi:hypothetical protein
MQYGTLRKAGHFIGSGLDLSRNHAIGRVVSR